jgi:hypothetical protein
MPVIGYKENKDDDDADDDADDEQNCDFILKYKKVIF